MPKALEALKPPPFEKWRKPIKAAVAMLIGCIMTFSDRCREAIGSASLLVAISVVFYFPFKTVGVVFEDVILGTFSALVSTAYCCLGMYAANLARDPNNPSPVQPKSSGILVVFLFVATFFMSYIRIKIPRAMFPTIIASILVCFVLTQSSVIPGFQPVLLWTFLKPLALGGGICVAVSALIWPDDSMSNYMAILSKNLSGFNAFFKEHSEGFLLLESTPRDSQPTADPTLPTMNSRLQDTTLMLIDCKRAVHRDIIFSRLNGKDVSKLTQLVKNLQAPLYGIGLSQICRNKFLRKIDDEKETAVLNTAIQDIRDACGQLADTCNEALKDSIDRLQSFHGNTNRTALNSMLWPFPRLFCSQRRQRRPSTKGKDEEYTDMQGQQPHVDSQQLRQQLDRLKNQACESTVRLYNLHHDNIDKRHVGGMHVLSLYRYNLFKYAERLIELIEFIETIEVTRTRRRLWFPTIKALKKWFQSSSSNSSDPNLGAGQAFDTNQMGGGLVRIQTKDDENNDSNRFVSNGRSSKLYHRDPDCNPPETTFQRICYKLYIVKQWFYEADTFFAFKTAAGTVLLALPIYLKESAAWYVEWHGQWADIIAMLWLMPTTGVFYFSGIMRVVGTVAGGVLAIVVWEISRGNPYGLGVLIFVMATFFYYILIYKPLLRTLAIMTLITMVLVDIYEYQYQIQGIADANPVWTIAGMRMLLVIIGIVAAIFIMMIPTQVTGRVELRKRLAQTLRDVGRMFGFISRQFLGADQQEYNDDQIKHIRRLVLDLQRQISDERTFLMMSRFEPPLRGKFPTASYGIVVEKVSTMVFLIYSMCFALRDMDPQWREKVAISNTEERKVYVASILTTIKLIATTLASKMALPPYMVPATQIRDHYADILFRTIQVKPEDLTHPSFLPYTSYIVARHTFVDELQELLEAVQDLVGVEDPDEWLRSYS